MSNVIEILPYQNRAKERKLAYLIAERILADKPIGCLLDGLEEFDWPSSWERPSGKPITAEDDIREEEEEEEESS